MANFKCAYCAKNGYGEAVGGPMSASSRPNGWLQNKSFGFGIKYYCSRRCKDFGEGVVINDRDRISNSNLSPEQILTQSQVELESRRLNIEERRMRDEDERREAAERLVKSEKYKEKGWLFIAWLVKTNPVYLIPLFYPILCVFFRGGIQLFGIISIVIFGMLLAKDLGKLSWEKFIVITILVLTVVSLGWYFISENYY